MNKNEYISKLKALDAKRTAICDEISHLRAEYISSSRAVKDFPYDSKVIVIFPENKKKGWEKKIFKCYVSGHTLDFDNNVRPELIKLKANDEPYRNGAQAYLPWWRGDYTIKLIETIEISK